MLLAMAAVNKANLAAKRRVVDMLKEVVGVLERLVCKAGGLARSTYRRTRPG
ncbi:hypothetical protein [Mycobacterium haemophilum]|uniref:hypothetical protein n=1 Tax=Mycobacterium haemophilum TaxID=29311 RepID=UPI000A63DD4C|nr:hypothetical protein [Mycobacterium haemophilum]MCV7339973.1 hypothetical protein [Mycobacterium haemophilum DSM 44634]